MSDGRKQQMDAIESALVGLADSPLYSYRQEHQYHAVVGEGSLNAQVMLIGEAPGEREAKTGRPFVGASGRFLDELLASIGLKREDIYITNVVKDRPPENRDPTPEEIALYAPFLAQQIEIIQPMVIATLGRFAMSFVMEFLHVPLQKVPKISDVHGQVFQGKAGYGPVAVVPLFHPAVALYSVQRRDTLFADVETLRPYLQAE
ncbi:MAG: uracil-DNA glycosylase [Caldilineaceae bacterium]|nr:uracil-DNA glycosylase [Caldilineaceae bacterium]